MSETFVSMQIYPLRSARTALLSLTTAALLCSGTIPAIAHAETHSPSDAKGGESKGGESKPGAAKGEEKKPPKERPGLSGLYLGTVEVFDPAHRFIFLRALTGHNPRRTFYLDARTIFRKKRERISADEVRVGQKVGVRYLSANHLALAEGIFVIPGEIELRDLQMPKKKVQAPPPAAEGEGKKAEGAKPPPPKPAAPAKKHGE